MFQVHRTVCDLPDLSCSQIFFCFKSLSMRSRNDRISASLIPLSLNEYFLHFPRQGRRKKLDRQQANCPALAFKINRASLGNLQQNCNCAGLKCKTHNSCSKQSIWFFSSSHIQYSSKHTLEGRAHVHLEIIKPVREKRQNLVTLKFTASSDFIRLIVGLPLSSLTLNTAASRQHITNHLVTVPVILMVQSSLLLFRLFLCSDKIVLNSESTLVKMLMEGNEGTFYVKLNSRKWQVLTSASWIKPFWAAQLTLLFQQAIFISITIHPFDMIKIFAFFRVPFPSACISSLMSFGVSHVAFKEPSFWQSGPRVSAPSSSVMHSQKVLDGDQARSSCGPQIFGHPAADDSER